MTRTLRAHFDGQVIIPDEPVDLPVGEPLQVELKRLPELAETALPPETAPLPEHAVPANEAMLTALRQVEAIQRGMNPKPGGDTQAYIREARSGALYGYEPAD
jgi:hypothetical protein